MSSARPSWYTIAALSFHIVSLVIPSGLMAFMVGLQTVVDHFTDRADSSGGTWLLVLSWLANPVFWVGMVLLGRGQRHQAVVAGEIAVLLALCTVSSGYLFMPYYVWITGMILSVYGALLGLAPAV